MTDKIQAVLERLEYYEAVHPDPVQVQRIPFAAEDLNLLHKMLRDYEDAQRLVRNAKFHDKKTKELENIRARNRDAIAILLFKYDSLLGINLNDGRTLRIARGRADKPFVVLKLSSMPNQSATRS